MELEIAGIPVRIIKKDIKNMHLYVKPPDGHVEVSAPQHLSDDSIAMFIRTRVGWIKKQQEKFRVQPRQTEREFISSSFCRSSTVIAEMRWSCLGTEQFSPCGKKALLSSGKTT